MKRLSAEDIFGVIRRHRGSGNAVTGREIAMELGWPEGIEREVRRFIADEFVYWPEIVCARLRGRGDEGGYFIPETYEEIEAYWAYLSDLASKAEAKVERFEQACAKAGFKLQRCRAGAPPAKAA
jgi:hypothetical protein